MRRAILICAVATLATANAWAQLTPKYAAWPDGPEGLLLTPQERTAYGAIATDEQAQEFIDLFWAKRDPNLDTKLNELKVDFDARVAAADEQFAEKHIRGALSDRGKVLLMMGRPDGRSNQGIDGFLTGLYGRGRRDSIDRSIGSVTEKVKYGISYNATKGKADIWLYNRDRIPEGVGLPTRMKSVMVVFFDTQGTGHFEMQRKIRDAKWAAAALESMPAKLLVHPELTAVPAYPLIAGASAATADQLAWLAVDPAPWPEGAYAGATQGVMTETIFPAWVYVGLPTGAPAADLMVGRLTRADGTVEGTFQKSVTAVAGTKANVYELELPAPVGASRLELALAAQGTPVAVTTLDVNIEDVAPDATYFTPFAAGAEVIDLPSFTAGDPFVYGGHHLVPRLGEYGYDESLNYFCLIVRPSLGADGQPKAQMKMRLYRGHQPASPKGEFRDVALSEVAPNVYMFGSQLPASIFHAGGKYALKVTIKDPVSGAGREDKIHFVLPEKK